MFVSWFPAPSSQEVPAQYTSAQTGPGHRLRAALLPLCTPLQPSVRRQPRLTATASDSSRGRSRENLDGKVSQDWHEEPPAAQQPLRWLSLHHRLGHSLRFQAVAVNHQKCYTIARLVLRGERLWLGSNPGSLGASASPLLGDSPRQLPLRVG